MKEASNLKKHIVRYLKILPDSITFYQTLLCVMPSKACLYSCLLNWWD